MSLENLWKWRSVVGAYLLWNDKMGIECGVFSSGKDWMSGLYAVEIVHRLRKELILQSTTPSYLRFRVEMHNLQ